MDMQHLKQQFARIGATLTVTTTSTFQRGWRPRGFNDPRQFTLDIQEDKQGERFLLTVREDMQKKLQFLPVDVQPKQRHLLLMSKRLDGQDDKQKFLCGHDERHWFVAGVPSSGVVNVRAAMESLKPDMAIASQQHRKVKAKNWHKRHNAGFIRQGEWFFIPQPNFEPDTPHLILRNEPISRGWGKPHIVEEVYRSGGETVYVSRNHPNGLTASQYKALLKRDVQARRLNWTVMRRNPQVYGRGKVRHPDHQTIVLPLWHRIAMNGEQRVQAVAFLD